MLKNQIVELFMVSGKTVIAKIEELEKNKIKVSNPLVVYPVEDGKIGFFPDTYSNPKKMEKNIHFHAIESDGIPDESIVNAYIEYVRQLTSSIITLDKNIQKTTQFNG